MIYDCFIFFNELELLELRLNELDSVVDRFVLVEATRTFTNQEKPLYFHENRRLFEVFLDKIIHIPVDDFPEYTDAWSFEFYQRNQIGRVREYCKPDDIILISDVDEIPRPEAILKAVNLPGVKVLEQKMFYYYFNMLNYRQPIWLLGTRMLRSGEFTRPASDIRGEKGTRVPDGGWHFSFLGGVDRIVKKIESFSHQEYNLDSIKDKERIEEMIRSGKDLFGRKKKRFEYRAIPMDDTFPRYLLNNQSRFEKMIIEPQPPLSLIDKVKNLF